MNNRNDNLSPEEIDISNDYNSDDNRDILTRLVKDEEEKGKKGKMYLIDYWFS